MKKIDVVTILGIISFTYWFADILNNFYFLSDPSWSLWFSSVGIGLTAVGLLTRNSFLLSSLFCALFIVEIGWNIGFFSHVLFGESFMGLTDYLFEGQYGRKDFLITSYHIVMIPFLFIGIIRAKEIHRNAWIGAAIITFFIASLTYLFVAPSQNVNCVHMLDNCRPFLSFLENINNPLRTAVAIIIATLFLYIPTNYLLVKTISGTWHLTLNGWKAKAKG